MSAVAKEAWPPSALMKEGFFCFFYFSCSEGGRGRHVNHGEGGVTSMAVPLKLCQTLCDILKKI